MSKIYSSAKSLWFLWVLIYSVGIIISHTFVSRLDIYFNHNYKGLFILIMIASYGLLTSFGQWILFRTRFIRSWLWIPATAFGLPLGFLVGIGVSLLFIFGLLIPISYDLQNILLGAIQSTAAGLFTGLLQWLALYKKTSGSLGWILVSAFSWGTGFTFSYYINNTYLLNYEFGPFQHPILGFMVGTSVGAISGAFVKSVLIDHHPEVNMPV